MMYMCLLLKWGTAEMSLLGEVAGVTYKVCERVDVMLSKSGDNYIRTGYDSPYPLRQDVISQTSPWRHWHL